MQAQLHFSFADRFGGVLDFAPLDDSTAQLQTLATFDFTQSGRQFWTATDVVHAALVGVQVRSSGPGAHRYCLCGWLLPRVLSCGCVHVRVLACIVAHEFMRMMGRLLLCVDSVCSEGETFTPRVCVLLCLLPLSV